MYPSGQDATRGFSFCTSMIPVLMFTIAENPLLAIGKNSYCSKN